MGPGSWVHWMVLLGDLGDLQPTLKMPCRLQGLPPRKVTNDWLENPPWMKMYFPIGKGGFSNVMLVWCRFRKSRKLPTFLLFDASHFFTGLWKNGGLPEKLRLTTNCWYRMADSPIDECEWSHKSLWFKREILPTQSLAHHVLFPPVI